MIEYLTMIMNGEFDPYLVAGLLSVTMIILLFCGFPMIFPIAIATLIGMIHFSDVSAEVLIQQMVTGIQPNALIAVPMFILAAEIMTKGKSADNLLNLIEVFIGHRKGGLPITACISCTLFGSVSGSTQATVVSVGKIMRPKLLKSGYKDCFIMALIINASDIAYLIPPSIGLILFGTLANTSIGELFIAGIFPGILLTILFCIYSYIYSVKNQNSITEVPRRTSKDKINAIKKSILPLGFPLLIIGGIYSGIITPTEAASFAVLYALIIEVFIYRSLSYKDIKEATLSTGLITGVVFILVGIGQAFSWYISFEMIPQDLLDPFNLDNASQELILLVIAISFFIGCMFVDSIVVLLILTPIFIPITTMAGIDPVLVGVLITLQMAIGSATPPFGCDIFTAIAIFKKSYLDVIKGTPPFILILLAFSAILILFPSIVLYPKSLLFE